MKLPTDAVDKAAPAVEEATAPVIKTALKVSGASCSFVFTECFSRYSLDLLFMGAFIVSFPGQRLNTKQILPRSRPYTRVGRHFQIAVKRGNTVNGIEAHLSLQMI